jgi:hypothetical protein
MMKYRVFALFLSHVIVLGHIAVAQNAATAARNGPISMDRTGLDSLLYVLDESGGIWRSTQDNLDVPTTKIGQVPTVFNTLDLAVARVGPGNGDVLFIAVFETQKLGRPAAIRQYSSDGQFVCDQSLPEISLGLDIDASSRTLYVSGASSGTIYESGLPKLTSSNPCLLGKDWTTVCTIPNSIHLGKLAVDGDHELFAADVIGGTIWQIYLRNPKYLRKVSGLGQPISLVMGRSHLYALDQVGRKIIRIKENTFGTGSAKFNSSTSFVEPSSLALGSKEDEILVGDRRTLSIYAVKKASGKVVGISSMPR